MVFSATKISGNIYIEVLDKSAGCMGKEVEIPCGPPHNVVSLLVVLGIEVLWIYKLRLR